MAKYPIASVAKSDINGKESWAVFYADDDSRVPNPLHHSTRLWATTNLGITLDEVIQHLSRWIRPKRSNIFIIDLKHPFQAIRIKRPYEPFDPLIVKENAQRVQYKWDKHYADLENADAN